MNTEDFAENGFTLEESTQVVLDLYQVFVASPFFFYHFFFLPPFFCYSHHPIYLHCLSVCTEQHRITPPPQKVHHHLSISSLFPSPHLTIPIPILLIPLPLPLPARGECVRGVRGRAVRGRHPCGPSRPHAVPRGGREEVETRAGGEEKGDTGKTSVLHTHR